MKKRIIVIHFDICLYILKILSHPGKQALNQPTKKQLTHTTRIQQLTHTHNKHNNTFFVPCSYHVRTSFGIVRLFFGFFSSKLLSLNKTNSCRNIAFSTKYRIIPNMVRRRYEARTKQSGKKENIAVTQKNR